MNGKKFLSRLCGFKSDRLTLQLVSRTGTKHADARTESSKGRLEPRCYIAHNGKTKYREDFKNIIRDVLSLPL